MSKGRLRHGMFKEYPLLYRRWRLMMNRCYQKTNASYRNYGLKGIVVCDDWQNPKVFVEWAKNSGFSPSLQLDRIDNLKGYCPENCRWVTPSQNLNNRSVTMFIDGKPLSEVAKEYGLSSGALRNRVKSGWSKDKLLLPIRDCAVGEFRWREGDEKLCQSCGKAFTAKPAQMKNKTCSEACKRNLLKFGAKKQWERLRKKNQE